MQSRRDCKRDSRFDRLMQQLYGDLQGFEEQVRLNALFGPVVRGGELGSASIWRVLVESQLCQDVLRQTTRPVMHT